MEREIIFLVEEAPHSKGRGNHRMKLPRDMGGEELAALLGRYGYKIIRQTGSHIRLTSTL